MPYYSAVGLKGGDWLFGPCWLQLVTRAQRPRSPLWASICSGPHSVAVICSSLQPSCIARRWQTHIRAYFPLDQMTKLTLLDKYKLKNNYCFCYFGTDAGARIRFLCQFPPPSQLSALFLRLALLCPLSSPADMQGKPRRCEQCRAVFSHAACPGTMFAPEICTPLLVIK